MREKTHDTKMLFGISKAGDIVLAFRHEAQCRPLAVAVAAVQASTSETEKLSCAWIVRTCRGTASKANALADLRVSIQLRI